MDTSVERILNHEPGEHDVLPAFVAEVADEVGLWELMDGYNWDEGFAVPRAVVEHPRCDRALALRLFWDLDDAAQIHLEDEDNGLREAYSSVAEYEPEDFADLVVYCTILVQRIREGSYPIGTNTFDTGMFDLDNPVLTDRQRKLRESRTTIARRSFEDAFLYPVLDSSRPG
jgi:hypothetical protein